METIIHSQQGVALDGKVVSELATGPKIPGIKPGLRQWTSTGDKTRNMTSFGR
jgi:hypothetical protein